MNTKEQIQVSIIIPVYKAECFLGDCINSLKQQTSADFEAIFIDDASPDGSLAILKKAAEEDNHFVVISQSNAGSSAARCTGLKAARGRIICFLDDDDVIEPTMVETVLKNMSSETDILAFGTSMDFVEEQYSVSRCPRLAGPTKDRHAVLEDLFAKDSFNTLWNKAYRAEFLKGHDNWFPTGFCQGEDLIFNCQAFQEAEVFQCIPASLYHYIKRTRETLVSSYTAHNEFIMQEKLNALKLLFSDPYDPVLCRYLLKEYEAYVINLVMPKAPEKKQQKIETIGKIVLNQESLYQIKHGCPDYFNGKVFRFLCQFHSAGFLLSSYKLLMKMKNTFQNTYQKTRKKSYQAKEKADE